MIPTRADSEKATGWLQLSHTGLGGQEAPGGWVKSDPIYFVSIKQKKIGVRSRLVIHSAQAGRDNP